MKKERKMEKRKRAEKVMLLNTGIFSNQVMLVKRKTKSEVTR